MVKDEIYITSEMDSPLMDIEDESFKMEGNCAVCPDTNVPVNLMQPSGLVARHYGIKVPFWMCNDCWARYGRDKPYRVN